MADFTFVHITDHHLEETEHTFVRGFATAHSLGRVLDAIAAQGAHGADFLVSTGDLVNRGTAAEYAFARRYLGLTGDALPFGLNWGSLQGLPGYFMAGNHDGDGFPWLQDAAFIHKGVQFLALYTGKHNRGAQFTADTLAFARRIVAAGLPTVVLMHHNPLPTGADWLDSFLPPNLGDFWAALRGGRVLAVLHGHAHMTLEQEVEGIPVLGLRSTCFQFPPTEEPIIAMMPPHYRVLRWEGGRLTHSVHEVAL